MTKAEKEAAKAAKQAEKEAGITAPKSAGVDGIEVGDPQVLRPRELPLVIKPANGGAWKNGAQAEFARVLNGYAYKNTAKWEKKKDVLLKQLVEIGEDPTAINKYRGVEDGISFKDKTIQA